MLVFYLISKTEVRTYNTETKKYVTMATYELYKQKTYFYMTQGFEPTDTGLLNYSKQLLIWGDELKNNNKFKIDYIKFGSHRNAVVRMFEKLCHDKIDMFEEIDDIEYRWLESSNNSGLRYCKPGIYEDCHGYDFKAFYPTILASKGLMVPTKKGVEKTITELDISKLQVGFYKVRIMSNDVNFKKIFLFSKDNVYTHISLLFASQCQREKMDVKIELIMEPNNCYIYGKHFSDGLLEGKAIFNTWFECLVKLKNEFPKNALVKILLSSVWGQFCQHNKLYKTDDEIDEENINLSLNYDKKYDYYLKDILYKKNGEQINVLVNCKKPYRYNIGRIKPFLLARGRYLTGKIAMLYIDDLVRIHTDGIIFDKEHDDVMTTYKSFGTLCMEDKTTGKMEFKGLNCYKNFTTNYECKNWEDDEENICI
jgi:hypothetical protein